MLFVSKPNADQFAYPYYIALDCAIAINKDPQTLMERCSQEKNIIWMEWANDMTAILTERKYRAKTIVRVHDHEVYRGRVDNVNWGNVDAIWFINKQTQEAFNRRLSVNCEQFYLPNAILPEQFYIGKKDKKIAFLSIFARKRKRLDRAIEIMEKVNERDPEWQLEVMWDPMYHEMEWDDWDAMIDASPANIVKRHRLFNESTQKFKGDVNDFFSDKKYVISTSEHEAFHYAVAEGAACGAYPLVLPWEWGDADQFWPTLKAKDMTYQVLKGDPDPQDAREIAERFDAHTLKTYL